MINFGKLILVVCIVVSLLLTLRVNSWVIATSLGILLISSLKYKFEWAFVKSKLFIFCSVLFSILILGSFRPGNSSSSWLQIEGNLFLIALPVILFQFKNAGINTTRLLNYFSIASLSTVALGLIKILLFYDIENTSRILSEGHLEFTEVIGGIHPTYLSMYFMLISFYSLEELRHASFSNGFIRWLPQLIYLALSIVVLVFLRSQMALMVFTTVLIFYLLVITRKRAWLIAFFLFTVGLITLLLDSKGTLSQLSYYGKNVSTALDNRVVLWKAVINGLKGNVLFGAGTGGEQALINASYRQASFSEGLENSFNAHNQYLQFVCRNGLFELGAFLALLIYCFWKAQHEQNLVFMLFLISFSLLMLTESCLNTQRGIVFFYFFVSVFVFLPYKSDKTVPHPTLDKSII
jgi:O-antigen ligase